MPVAKEIKVLFCQQPSPRVEGIHIQKMLCMLKVLCVSHFISLFKRVLGMSKVLEFEVL